MGEELSLPIEPVEELARAVATADIVLAATWSTKPLILPGMLSSGAHVTTLGADEPGKAEVSADVIRSSLFVCDDRHLAIDMGALRGVGLDADVIINLQGDEPLIEPSAIEVPPARCQT